MVPHLIRKSGLRLIDPGGQPRSLSYGETQERTRVKDYLKRPQDVANAVQSLRNAGLSVGLPHQTANGEMFFEIEGYVLTVAQILELFDKNELGRAGIHKSGTKRTKDAG